MPDDLISKKQEFGRTRLSESARILSQGGGLFFTGSAIIFASILAVWGGLFLYRRALENNASVWREQVAVLERELSPDVLNQVLVLFGRLSGAHEILANHIFSSNVLALLEKDTHPRVYFQTFQYASQPKTVTLLAKAASYSDVAEQITLLEADPQVESVNFGGLALDEGGLVNFKLTIIFKPSLLKLRPR